MAHAEAEKVRELLAKAQQLVPVGSRWRHYKGGEYTAIGVAIRESDEEPVVVYESPDGLVWTRPLGEWLEDVDGVQRFGRIG